jgi:hypothetical protein
VAALTTLQILFRLKVVDKFTAGALLRLLLPAGSTKVPGDSEYRENQRNGYLLQIHLIIEESG